MAKISGRTIDDGIVPANWELIKENTLYFITNVDQLIIRRLCEAEMCNSLRIWLCK